MAVKAALESPLAGRFETNVSAKRWILISPGGETFVVRNLLKWARENTYRFGKEQSEKSAEQIAKGFGAIAQTMQGRRGVPGKQRGAMTYFGWSLQGPPSEIKEYKEEK